MNKLFVHDEFNISDEKYAAIRKFCTTLCMEKRKGKVPFIITGSGISSKVPNVQKMLDQLEMLIDSKRGSGQNFSQVFNKIYEEYTSSKSLAISQSKFLTYIQNAYMGKKSYVQKEDIQPLGQVWGVFINWLLRECNIDGKNGLLNATCTESHRVIAELYERTGGISITTNFDNLLSKAFNSKELQPKDDEMPSSDRNNHPQFYPLLDEDSFNLYFTSTSSDGSYIEIQTRGDVFWIECSGDRQKICNNIGVKCYVPNKNISIDPNTLEVICANCGSTAKIHFAFPGTKEKDYEMSRVMNGLWKYLAYRCSAIILVGISLDYDPVLLRFIQELIFSRKIPLLCISRSEAENFEPRQTSATKILCNPSFNIDVTWLRCKDAATGLSAVSAAYQICSKDIKEFKEIESLPQSLKSYRYACHDIIGNKGQYEKGVHGLEREGLHDLIHSDEYDKISLCSQLGLKTYWLKGEEHVNRHNRLKHSLGVLAIASLLYLSSRWGKAKKEELQFIQLAALLHDIGHLPFSHLMEEVFDEFGWAPGGMARSFNHEDFGHSRIAKILEKKGLFKDFLASTQYSELDLNNLVRGEFGIGYLDAIINSPFDADKIEYLFSDSIFTGRSHNDLFEDFLTKLSPPMETRPAKDANKLSSLSVSDNYFWVLEGESTQNMLQLLNMRGEMYSTLYLRNGLRYLEACCKLIIRTFISHKCGHYNYFSNNYDKLNYFYNLSEVKINYITEYLIEKMDEYLEIEEDKQVFELYLIENMKSELLKDSTYLSESMKHTVENCYKYIKSTKNETAVSRIEKERVRSFEISATGISKESISQLAKLIYIRFPGVILVDHIKSKAAFSFSKAGKAVKRQDGSLSSVENILIRHINKYQQSDSEPFRCLGQAAEDIIKILRIPTQEYINIYRVTDNLSLFLQAEDFVLGHLRELGLHFRSSRS